MNVLSIITQEKIVYQGGFSSITLPGAEGELSILPGHAPLITPLKLGKIKVKDKTKKQTSFEIERGILEVNPKEVNILVDLR